MKKITTIAGLALTLVLRLVPWRRRNLILKTERAGNAGTFRTTYGTETSNYRNAFGECVSRTAGENDTD